MWDLFFFCNMFFSVKYYKVYEALLCNQSLNGVSHNMRSNEKGDVTCLNVPQVNIRETSGCDVFPSCPGDDASVPKKEPQAFKHVLEEEGPA